MPRPTLYLPEEITFKIIEEYMDDAIHEDDDWTLCTCDINGLLNSGNRRLRALTKRAYLRRCLRDARTEIEEQKKADAFARELALQQGIQCFPESPFSSSSSKSKAKPKSIRLDRLSEQQRIEAEEFFRTYRLSRGYMGLFVVRPTWARFWNSEDPEDTAVRWVLGFNQHRYLHNSTSLDKDIHRLFYVQNIKVKDIQKMLQGVQC